MTNMADCLAAAGQAGRLDPARAADATENLKQLVARYEQIMPPAQAAATAAADLKEATARAVRSRFHAVTNQMQTMRRIKAAIGNASDPAIAIRNLLEYSENSGYRGESVSSIRQAYEGQINATLHEVLDKVGINVWAKSRDMPTFLDVIRELHGQATNNPGAVHLADAVRTAQDRMRRAFNSFGGDIGELANYGVKHSHDAGRMMAAGPATWKREIKDLLAWDRIIDVTTGQTFAAKAGQGPADTVSADRFLQSVYDNLTSQGWDRRDPTMTVGGKALYNRRADHRVMHFRDGDAWLAYNGRFGQTDPFSAMIGGLYGMARDVALMRVLGPNPVAGLEYAIQVAKQRAGLAAMAARTPEQIGASARLHTQIAKKAALARTMLHHASGAASVPEDAAWAAFFAGTRAVLTSAQLGSATLSSVTDLATMRMAARVVGMNSANLISRSVELVANSATRQTAARMGFVAECLADAGSATSRYFGASFFGAGLPDRLATMALRTSGLSWLTDMRKVAFKMEFAGHLADSADLAFHQLDPKLHRVLANRGVTAADWDALRDPAVRFIDQRSGADFIAPSYWLENQTAMSRAEAEGLAVRLEAIMVEQLEFAIPTSSLEGRAHMIGENPAGSLRGELSRSWGMYHGFALSLTFNQFRRVLAMPGGVKTKALYAAELSATMTLMGALTIQLKEISKGNDPRPMDNLAFWAAAFLQGSGVGIFGDFFSSSTSRAGGGFARTLAGPVVSFANDLAMPVMSNIERTANGQPSLLGRDVSNLVRRYTPVASSLWYVRAGYDRIVADTLQRMLDPDAEAQWRQQARKREREYGTTAWWSRGHLLPGRAPDFSNSLGDGNGH